MPETGEMEVLPLEPTPSSHRYPHTHHFSLTLNFLKWAPIVLLSPLLRVNSLMSSIVCYMKSGSFRHGIMRGPSSPSPTFPTSVPALLTLCHSTRMLTVPHPTQPSPPLICSHSSSHLILQVLPIHQGPLQMPLPPESHPFQPSQTATLFPFASKAQPP